MVLRVWAMYSQSRFILGTLLTFYSIERIIFLVDRGTFHIEKKDGV